jgi:hypothetical protein
MTNFASFRYPASATQTVDRASVVRNKLLQILLEADKRGFDTFDHTGNASLRSVCFDWADALLFELRVEQPAIERGACLEGLAAILETPCLSARAIDSSPQDSAAFRGLMVRVVAFVMTKLGAKGVFHNSLLFSGRVLVSAVSTPCADHRHSRSFAFPTSHNNFWLRSRHSDRP